MIYFWLVCLLVLNFCWLGLVFFALPGNWLVVISTGLFAWWRWEDGIFSIYTLIAITLLAFVAEIFEFFAGMGGAKKAGAGWKGAFAALAGAIIGAGSTITKDAQADALVVTRAKQQSIKGWAAKFRAGQQAKKNK